MGETRGPSIVVCGVYCVTCWPNGRQYIGSSDNIPNRWRVHRTRLDQGIHPAELWLADWEQLGSVAFGWAILERVDRKTDGSHLQALLAAEQKWIDQLHPDYNTLQQAGSSDGYIHTEAARERMREAKRKRKQTKTNENRPANDTGTG
jgi:group I intron endonuclease